ncbi:formimidoylglutamase [Lentiprolixibacter aurantiacus]|uniref:Formimidoylglutamase n=1 Tax=Lentiprolixibacter aurantiacus TaxID=2993939 RepID=A0AAE3ML87_9FLAO|nr:formimidoylglutamase [Lentiprolixibacter aurantiacus]MCX2718959.1 formimidoylglutamase [Lentiprolixibacter aurantiacus]
MKNYHPPERDLWQGRSSGNGQYLHECVGLLELERSTIQEKGFVILGYACDEGVRRNQGRTGAIEGPDAIKRELARLPSPPHLGSSLWDAGNIGCVDQDLEAAQHALAEKVKDILNMGSFPLLLGGGHDIAFGHFTGLCAHLQSNESIGIINLDAHFDLRSCANGANSGTPFYQIARELQKQDRKFQYLCMGIREEANAKMLFDTARELGVSYVPNSDFHLGNTNALQKELDNFFEQTDKVYLTIDLDGFSSAYSPGVSAASPFGFSPDIVLWTMKQVINSGKLLSLDLAECNPRFDRDGQTAKLAAGLMHYVLRHNELF